MDCSQMVLTLKYSLDHVLREHWIVEASTMATIKRASELFGSIGMVAVRSPRAVDPMGKHSGA